MMLLAYASGGILLACFSGVAMLLCGAHLDDNFLSMFIVNFILWPFIIVFGSLEGRGDEYENLPWIANTWPTCVLKELSENMKEGELS